jgi:hypothetical protein
MGSILFLRELCESQLSPIICRACHLARSGRNALFGFRASRVTLGPTQTICAAKALVSPSPFGLGISPFGLDTLYVSNRICVFEGQMSP